MHMLELELPPPELLEPPPELLLLQFVSGWH